MTTLHSKVLHSIDSFKSNVVRALELQKRDQNSQFHTKGVKAAAEEPSAIKCVSSSFRLTGSFIDKDSRNFSTHAEFCSGLSSCSFCNACSRCSGSGCDSSNEDSFCQATFGASSKCVLVPPLQDNNFTQTSCSEPVNASASMMAPKPSENPSESSLVWISVAVGSFLCIFALFFGIRRYLKVQNANAVGISPMNSKQVIANSPTASNSPAASSVSPPQYVSSRATQSTSNVSLPLKFPGTIVSVSPPVQLSAAAAASNPSPSYRRYSPTASAVALPFASPAFASITGRPILQATHQELTSGAWHMDPVHAASSVSPPQHVSFRASQSVSNDLPPVIVSGAIVSASPPVLPSVTAASAFYPSPSSQSAVQISLWAPTNVQISPPANRQGSWNLFSSLVSENASRAVPSSHSQSFIRLVGAALSASPHWPGGSGTKDPMSLLNSVTALPALNTSLGSRGDSSSRVQSQAFAAANLPAVSQTLAATQAPCNWEADVHDDGATLRRHDNEPVLPRPRTPRAATPVRKSASADLFSDQVSDDEAQHSTRTRPANFENDFTNESETAIFAAALEELRFDFNSAAAAAAATLAAELDKFSDDCSV